MNTERPAENPWLRPGFLVSSCVVAVIAALGIYIGVAGTGDDHPDVPVQRVSTPRALPTAARPSPRASGGGSICGLPDNPGAGAAVDLRSTSWRYSNATAYPTSPVYGPGRRAAPGYRYCFQRSPGGALFAAANSLAFDNSSIAEARAWWGYMLADGPYRQARLADSYVPSDPTARLQIIGYRMMSYTGREAWVDIAVRTSTAEGTIVVSVVTHLVWQRGDWRFSTDELASTNATRISDLTGYTTWGVS